MHARPQRFKRVRKADVMKGGTLVERVSSDARHGFGDLDFRQSRAAEKQIIGDRGDPASKGDLIELGAVLERRGRAAALLAERLGDIDRSKLAAVAEGGGSQTADRIGKRKLSQRVAVAEREIVDRGHISFEGHAFQRGAVFERVCAYRFNAVGEVNGFQRGAAVERF